ncbi:MAG: hypothetical protein AAF242_06230 [Bacteroidota bacterium]
MSTIHFLFGTSMLLFSIKRENGKFKCNLDFFALGLTMLVYGLYHYCSKNDLLMLSDIFTTFLLIIAIGFAYYTGRQDMYVKMMRTKEEGEKLIEKKLMEAEGLESDGNENEITS